MRSDFSLSQQTRSKRGAMQRLRSLCCSGFDPIMIAPQICELLHQLIPNAATAIFLTQPNGLPYAFFHEDSPDSAKLLFQNQPHLFDGAAEINVFKIVGDLSRPKSASLLHPDDSYYQSNTYQHLVRASGHHHSLDIRLDVNGVAAGALILFREHGVGFTEKDVPTLNQAARYIEHALGAEFSTAASDVITAEQATIVTSQQGDLMCMTDAATTLLQQVPTTYNFWQHGQPLPKFCMELLSCLKFGHAEPQLEISIPSGQLSVRAEWLHASPPHPALIALQLKHVIPRSLRCWQLMQASDLSPQQADVAYWLAIGHAKPVICARLGISDAVLKDAIKAIYQCFSVHTMTELIEHVQRQLRQPIVNTSSLRTRSLDYF